MNIKDFIRDRVLTFPVIVLFLINLAKKTLQVSLNEFCKSIDLINITKQAFSKARKKLSPKTFILLNIRLIEEFFTENTYSTWNGFRLIAVDGSDIQLPQNEQMKKQYGQAQNQNGPALPMAKISYAYDVLNRLTLDSQIDYCKAPERDLAIKHIETIQTHNHDKIQNLYIFDRGYPSLGFILYLASKKEDFLIRCSTSSCFSKVKKAFDRGEEDIIIRLYASEATDTQILEMKNRTPFLDRKTAFIDIRMVVVHLKTGEKELLITTLLNKQLYPKEEFLKLYNYRWGAEENYKWHKVAMEIENFSGETPLAIEQEIFASVLTANMASLLIQEAETEIFKEHETKNLKHEYKVNKRIALATMRDELMKGILDPEIDMDELCQTLKTDIKKYLCPVRPNRKYPRPKNGRRKFGCTTRKCI
jgi:hypothetical protein